MRGPAIRILVMSYLVLCAPSLLIGALSGTPELMSLPKGQVGIAYSAQIQTEGGQAPLAWRLDTGELPPGLSISASGALEGKPTTARRDPYTFTLSVSDSSQPAQTAKMGFSILIQAAPLRITGYSDVAPALKIVGVSPDGVPTTNSSTGNKPVDEPALQQSAAAPSASGATQNSSSGAAAAAGATANPPAGKSTSEKSAQICESTTAAYFPVPPATGLKVVSGCAGQAPGARVVVYAKDKVNSCPADVPDLTQPTPAGVIDDQPANVELKTGIFHAELTNRLTDDELICPYSISVDDKPPVVVTKWGYDEPESPIGRTRYFLSTGVSLSQDNQQFSNQDVYLGFALQRNWFRGATPGSPVTALLNSEFSAQLTSIPVAASSSTTTTSTAGSTPSVSTFISSRKAAVVGGDFYAPIYFNAFKGWFGTQTSGFFAPIIKGGLQSVTSGTLDASSPAPGTTTTSATVNGSGLYYFWGAGVRLGDLKLHESWNIAPEVLSHIDVTVGQWQNFKQCRSASNCTPGTDGTVPPSQLYQPLVLVLQGQFDVPKTPVQIGFQSVTPLHGGGQGDLRFYFGVKLDVGCIYKSFKGGTTPKFFDCTDDQPAATTTSNSAPATSGGAAAANGKAKNQ
jgi:Putative Ig domain